MFGLSAGAAPDRFLVGLAVLSLFSEVAEERPLLCVVDDAQWLDQASALTLAFVARRLLAEPVGIVFAAREPGEELSMCPSCRCTVCATATRARCWARRCAFMLDERVRDRIIAETRGNPLALLELPRGLTATELAGGFGLLGAQALSGRIEESFVRDSRRCPRTRGVCCCSRRPSRSAIRCCSGARPSGSGSRRRCGRRDGGRAAGDRRAGHVPSSAGALGGLPIGDAEDRRAVHLALAEATDREIDPDRRAWHLAAATPGPDEQVAAELERSAGRAQARGGLAAAAAFLERAVALTRDPTRRADARWRPPGHLGAGAFDAARGMLAAAEVGPLDELQRARLDLLRAEAAYSESRGSDAPALLLRAARPSSRSIRSSRVSIPGRLELGAVRRGICEPGRHARSLA